MQAGTGAIAIKNMAKRHSAAKFSPTEVEMKNYALGINELDPARRSGHTWADMERYMIERHRKKESLEHKEKVQESVNKKVHAAMVAGTAAIKFKKELEKKREHEKKIATEDMTWYERMTRAKAKKKAEETVESIEFKKELTTFVKENDLSKKKTEASVSTVVRNIYSPTLLKLRDAGVNVDQFLRAVVIPAVRALKSTSKALNTIVEYAAKPLIKAVDSVTPYSALIPNSIMDDLAQKSAHAVINYMLSLLEQHYSMAYVVRKGLEWSRKNPYTIPSDIWEAIKAAAKPKQ